MGKNGYLQRQKLRDNVHILAATDTERQYMVDLLCLVLNDPEIMGKDVLGKKRLQRVVRGISGAYDHWKLALTTQNEADYYRAKMDERLRAILGDDLIPFERRYDWLKSIGYTKKK